MKRLSKKAATLVGEVLTKLQYALGGKTLKKPQFDGSSGYACGGGADF
ncbi:unknown [Clostridium sp. CAG:729]|nr:unknown [Clostridium sp. CAG:729]